jgi:hypothetical protein
MYEFIITEVTKYGDTANCVGGFLFENGQPIGRKRLYIKDTNWASQYPPNRKFTLLQKLTFQNMEEGIVERSNMFTGGCYPREERIEDITVFPDEVKVESISEQEIWQMFDTLEIPLVNFPKYFPEFETKPSFKVFCPGKAMLDLTSRPSLFYFRMPVHQVRIEKQITQSLPAGSR